MTQENKQSELDLDQIEKELDIIFSDFPAPSDQRLKHIFYDKSPERIAALVKRVKTQTEALRKIAAIGRYEIEGKIYYTATGEIAEEALPEDLKLRRGSDEV